MFDMMDTMGKAVQQGFNDVSQALGHETDPDLMQYDRLTSDHFNKMKTKFGLPKVADYIKAMEAKRMGVK